jgi:hypothetical protein
MKKLLLFSFLVPFFFSCNKASSPKETAEQYIKALSSADLATASSLTTADTKVTLEKAKKEATNTAKPEESFQFSSFTETIDNNKAQVKNGVITLPLVKENGDWKVALNETLLHEIQSRDEMLVLAKTKWEDLLKEYEGRLQVLKQYIDYKRGMGALSPKVNLLNEAVNKFSKPTEWTKGNILAYAEKQRQLNNLIDAAMEPALAANTDLSLNYILQTSTATDRIKEAENDYQAAAQTAQSPIFVPLPFKQPTLVQADKK